MHDMNQREVRAQSRLEQEGLAAELHLLLALLDNCPDAGRREHATKTAAAGADALDQRALVTICLANICRSAFGLRPIWLAVRIDTGAASNSFPTTLAGGFRIVADHV